MKINNRISELYEYHFKALETTKVAMINDGVDILDLSIGEPDLEVKQEIKKALIESLNYDGFNKYPPYEGIDELKEEVKAYYLRRYNVKLENNEIIILIGSKEGLNNLIPAICNIGDIAITPSLAYPVYRTSCKIWGVENYPVPLLSSKEYFPDIYNIPMNIKDKAKLMMINYPNNPTGAILSYDFMNECREFSLSKDIVLCNDNAYGDIINKGEKPISILMKGKENMIEFGSFSKTYSMAGFRLGYAVGDNKVIRALSTIKSNVDSGQFISIQKAGIEALKLGDDFIDYVRDIYEKRRQQCEELLNYRNFEFFKGKGTFYIWVKTPKGYSSKEFCNYLLKEYGILVTPGQVFGYQGYDFFRISLTEKLEKIKKAFLRIKEV